MTQCIIEYIITLTMDIEQARKIFLDNFWTYNYFANEDLVDMGIPLDKIEAFTAYFHSKVGDEMDDLFSSTVNDFIDEENKE